jgi:hypothetical protein
LLTACALLIAGCSPDPIVGTWRSDSRVVEFHDDGTLTGVQRNDPACAGETAAIAACARRQRWQRSGSAYRITLMGLTRSSSAGLGGMFNGSGGSPCQCVVDITATAEVHGDELVIDGGKERAHRVK